MPDAIAIANDDEWDEDMYDRAQEHIEAFYEEVFLELAKYGEVEEVVVVDNVSDHMVGNTYVRYHREGDAEKCFEGLRNRFYGARLIQPEYSPVSEFREANCRAWREGRCARGGLCNFMHIKHIPQAVRRRTIRMMQEEYTDFTATPVRRASSRSRSRRRKEREEAKKKRASSAERRELISSWNREEALAQATGQSTLMT